MKFSLSASVCMVLSASLVTASVFPKNNTGDPGAVFTCTGAGWTGDCDLLEPRYDETCHSWKEGDYDGKPDSISPSWGGYCLLYDTEWCKGEPREKLVFPGVSQWGFRPTSMMCIKCDKDNVGENCRCKRSESAERKCGPCLFEDADKVRKMKDQDKPEYCDYPDID